MPKSRKRKVAHKKVKPVPKLYTLFIRVPVGTGDKKSNIKCCFQSQRMLYSEAMKEAQRYEAFLHSVILYDNTSGKPVMVYRSKIDTRDGTGIVNLNPTGVVNPNAKELSDFLHGTSLEDTDHDTENIILDPNRIIES